MEIPMQPAAPETTTYTPWRSSVGIAVVVLVYLFQYLERFNVEFKLLLPLYFFVAPFRLVAGIACVALGVTGCIFDRGRLAVPIGVFAIGIGIIAFLAAVLIPLTNAS